MPKIVGRNERGFVDPLSLFGLLFLVVTLAAVTFVTTNKNISLNIQEKAAKLGKTGNSAFDKCREESGREVCNERLGINVNWKGEIVNEIDTSNVDKDAPQGQPTCDANGVQYSPGAVVMYGGIGSNATCGSDGKWDVGVGATTDIKPENVPEYAKEAVEKEKEAEKQLTEPVAVPTTVTVEPEQIGLTQSTNQTSGTTVVQQPAVTTITTTTQVGQPCTNCHLTPTQQTQNSVQLPSQQTVAQVINLMNKDNPVPPTTHYAVIDNKLVTGTVETNKPAPQVLPDNNYGSCNGDPTCNSALTSIDRGMNAISFGGWSNYTEAYSPDKVKYTWQESGYKSVKECQDDMIAKNNNAQAAASCNTYQITKEQAISSIKLGTTLTAEAAAIIALPGAIGAGSTAIEAVAVANAAAIATGGTAIGTGATVFSVGGATLAPALTSFGAITTLTQTSAAAVAQITDPGSPEAWKQTGYAALSWLNIGTADKLIKSFGALDAAKKAGQATETLVTAAQSARNLNNVVSGINLAVDVPNAVSTCSQAGFFTGSCGGALAAVGADIVFGTVDYKRGQLGFGNPLTKVNEGALIGRIETPAEIDQINQLIANPFGTTPSISNVDGEVKFTPSRQLDMFDQLARDPVANTSTVVNNSTELIFPDKPARQDPNTNFNLTKSDPNEVAAIAAFNSTDINTQGGTVAQLTPSNLNSQIPNTPITDVTAPKPVEPNANIADDITKPLTGTANTDTVDSPATTNQSPTIASLLDDPNASVLDKANGVIDTLPDTGGAISIVKKINQIGDEIASALPKNVSTENLTPKVFDATVTDQSLTKEAINLVTSSPPLTGFAKFQNDFTTWAKAEMAKTNPNAFKNIGQDITTNLKQSSFLTKVQTGIQDSWNTVIDYPQYLTDRSEILKRLSENLTPEDYRNDKPFIEELIKAGERSQVTAPNEIEIIINSLDQHPENSQVILTYLPRLKKAGLVAFGADYRGNIFTPDLLDRSSADLTKILDSYINTATTLSSIKDIPHFNDIVLSVSGHPENAQVVLTHIPKLKEVNLINTRTYLFGPELLNRTPQDLTKILDSYVETATTLAPLKDINGFDGIVIKVSGHPENAQVLLTYFPKLKESNLSSNIFQAYDLGQPSAILIKSLDTNIEAAKVLSPLQDFPDFESIVLSVSMHPENGPIILNYLPKLNNVNLDSIFILDPYKTSIQPTDLIKFLDDNIETATLLAPLKGESYFSELVKNVSTLPQNYKDKYLTVLPTWLKDQSTNYRDVLYFLDSINNAPRDLGLKLIDVYIPTLLKNGGDIKSVTQFANMLQDKPDPTGIAQILDLIPSRQWVPFIKNYEIYNSQISIPERFNLITTTSGNEQKIAINNFVTELKRIDADYNSTIAQLLDGVNPTSVDKYAYIDSYLKSIDEHYVKSYADLAEKFGISDWKNKTHAQVLAEISPQIPTIPLKPAKVTFNFQMQDTLYSAPENLMSTLRTGLEPTQGATSEDISTAIKTISDQYSKISDTTLNELINNGVNSTEKNQLLSIIPEANRATAGTKIDGILKSNLPQDMKLQNIRNVILASMQTTGNEVSLVIRELFIKTNAETLLDGFVKGSLSPEDTSIFLNHLSELQTTALPDLIQEYPGLSGFDKTLESTDLWKNIKQINAQKVVAEQVAKSNVKEITLSLTNKNLIDIWQGNVSGTCFGSCPAFLSQRPNIIPVKMLKDGDIFGNALFIIQPDKFILVGFDPSVSFASAVTKEKMDQFVDLSMQGLQKIADENGLKLMIGIPDEVGGLSNRANIEEYVLQKYLPGSKKVPIQPESTLQPVYGYEPKNAYQLDPKVTSDLRNPVPTTLSQPKTTIFGYEFNGFKNEEGKFTLWPLEKATAPTSPLESINLSTKEVTNLVNSTKGPIIEVGGPTPGGYKQVYIPELNRRIFVSNIETGTPVIHEGVQIGQTVEGHVDLLTDSTKLPFADSSVGTILGSALEEQTIPQTLSEAHRVLEPDGILVLQYARSSGIEIINQAEKLGFKVISDTELYKFPDKPNEVLRDLVFQKTEIITPSPPLTGVAKFQEQVGTVVKAGFSPLKYVAGGIVSAAFLDNYFDLGMTDPVYDTVNSWTTGVSVIYALNNDKKLSEISVLNPSQRPYDEVIQEAINNYTASNPNSDVYYSPNPQAMSLFDIFKQIFSKDSLNIVSSTLADEEYKKLTFPGKIMNLSNNLLTDRNSFIESVIGAAGNIGLFTKDGGTYPIDGFDNEVKSLVILIEEEFQTTGNPVSHSFVIEYFLEKNNGDLAQAILDSSNFEEFLVRSLDGEIINEPYVWIQNHVLDEYSPLLPYQTLPTHEAKLTDSKIYYDYSLPNRLGEVYHAASITALLNYLPPEVIRAMVISEYLSYGDKHGLIKMSADLEVLKRLDNINNLLNSYNNIQTNPGAQKPADSQQQATIPKVNPAIQSSQDTSEQQRLELERREKIKSGLYAQIDADLATQTILGGAGKPFKNIGCGQVAVANILCEYGNYCPTPLQIAEQIPLQEYAESGLTSTQSNIKILNENGFTTDPYTKSLQYHLTEYMEPTDVLWISGIVGGIDHHTYINGYTLDKNGIAIYNLNDSYFGDGYKCKTSGDSSFSCDNPDGSHINIGAENANIYIIDTNI